MGRSQKAVRRNILRKEDTTIGEAAKTPSYRGQAVSGEHCQTLAHSVSAARAKMVAKHNSCFVADAESIR